MRARSFFAPAPAALVTLAAFAACTSSEGAQGQASSPEGDVVPPVPDAAPTDAAADVEADGALPTCSKAGWCTTPLPDEGLMVRDIWPLAGRAFAIAQSGTLGVKVLEWEDDGAGWRYIDDNTQNDAGGKFAGTIWAPDDDTVYFASAPSYVYRGTRLPPPARGWSWSRQRLVDNSHVGEAAHATHDHGYMRNPSLREDYPALGVWGVDAANVWAWYSNALYHRTDDAGEPSWAAEYVLDDPDLVSEHLFFVSAGGSGPDDLWFAAVRSRGNIVGQNCGVLIRKTPAGLARIADGVPASGITGDCTERAGYWRVAGSAGWVTDLQSTGPGTISGLEGGADILRISADGDALTVGVDVVPEFRSVKPGSNPFRSLWRSPSEVWLSSWGLVVRGQGEGDAANYSVSTISLSGAPIDSPIHRVRGSDTNLWVIGNGYAFHKTTP